MNSEIIKFVAGGGKTTTSAIILDGCDNGLYLAFTNSVVNEMRNKGYLSKTVDSLFTSFLIPKLMSLIPIISTSSRITIQDNTDDLQGYLKGISRIKINENGDIYRDSKKLKVNLSTKHSILQQMDSKENIGLLKYIFAEQELRLTHPLRDDLSGYLVKNHPEKITNLLNRRFSLIIIDEAQDLRSYRENFAQLLYRSPIKLIVLGDDYQNIKGGGLWFESLSPDRTEDHSLRCPEANCKWIRENLGIKIYGNTDPGKFKNINFESITDYDDGKRTLLYVSTNGKNGPAVNSWHGPKSTIGIAKGSTICEDIVIIGTSMNIKNYYTAITRTKTNVYSAVKRINK